MNSKSIFGNLGDKWQCALLSIINVFSHSLKNIGWVILIDEKRKRDGKNRSFILWLKPKLGIYKDSVCRGLTPKHRGSALTKCITFKLLRPRKGICRRMFLSSFLPELQIAYSLSSLRKWRESESLLTPGFKECTLGVVFPAAKHMLLLLHFVFASSVTIIKGTS